MGCLVTNFLYFCNEYTVGGINQVFITNRSHISDFLYLTSDTRFSTISGITNTVNPLVWYEYKTNPQTTLFSEKENRTKFGKTFQKSFEITFEKMEANKRSVLIDLLNSKSNITVVYKDYNSKWWLLGDDYGCTCTDYLGTTSTIKDQNFYKATLTTEGKSPVRQINSGYVTAAILPYSQNYITATTIYGFISCSYFNSHPLFDSLGLDLDTVINCAVYP